VRKSPVSATSNAEGSRARVEPIASAPVVDLRLQRRQSASFHGNISADGAFNFEPPGKNPFYATRECLFGMRQTGKCRERNVLMVRTTEEVVFRPPGGDIEGRAFRDRVSGQARAH
jgi:hypothetical protein